MQVLDAETIARHATPHVLVAALEERFRLGCEAPLRHHHDVPVPGEPNATLLLMPAWTIGEYLGVKVAGVFPGNSRRGQRAVSAAYLLFDARTGAPLAALDGGELTARRTAATSALAARYLMRSDARRMLMVGTGRLAEHLLRFHQALAPSLSELRVWGRSYEKAEAVATALAEQGLPVQATADLALAARGADLVSCATLAETPLLTAANIAPGTHVDLVGSFRPWMREADDTLMARGEVFVDSLDGASRESGDIIGPMASGVLHRDGLVELAALCRGGHPGRENRDSVTVFKSVGAALEDLAAAILVYESVRAAPG